MVTRGAKTGLLRTSCWLLLCLNLPALFLRVYISLLYVIHAPLLTPLPPPGPAYLVPYLFFSYMYCSCLENGLWLGWSKSFVTWYSLLGLSLLTFFWLSFSRPTRAASCNTIQMEYSKKSKAPRKRERPSVAPSPIFCPLLSFFSNKQLFVSAAFLVSCRLSLWADSNCPWMHPFRYSSWFYRSISVCSAPRRWTEIRDQTNTLFNSAQQNLTIRGDFSQLQQLLNYFLFVEGNNPLPRTRAAFQILWVL